jgi:hypothetical protein
LVYTVSKNPLRSTLRIFKGNPLPTAKLSNPLPRTFLTPGLINWLVRVFLTKIFQKRTSNHPPPLHLPQPPLPNLPKKSTLRSLFMLNRFPKKRTTDPLILERLFGILSK